MKPTGGQMMITVPNDHNMEIIVNTEPKPNCQYHLWSSVYM